MPKRLTHEDRMNRRKEIARLSEEGFTISEIKEKFNVTYSTIRTSCIENGVAIPASFNFTSKTANKGYISAMVVLAQLMKGELSGTEIAMNLGISRARVYQVMMEAVTHGISVHQRYKIRSRVVD